MISCRIRYQSSMIYNRNTHQRIFNIQSRVFCINQRTCSFKLCVFYRQSRSVTNFYITCQSHNFISSFRTFATNNQICICNFWFVYNCFIIVCQIICNSITNININVCIFYRTNQATFVTIFCNWNFTSICTC